MMLLAYTLSTSSFQHVVSKSVLACSYWCVGTRGSFEIQANADASQTGRHYHVTCDNNPQSCVSSSCNPWAPWTFQRTIPCIHHYTQDALHDSSSSLDTQNWSNVSNMVHEIWSTTQLLKRLSTTMCNFVNISKSLASRFQQHMCYQQLNEENYLKQDVSIPKKSVSVTSVTRHVSWTNWSWKEILKLK